MKNLIIIIQKIYFYYIYRVAVRFRYIYLKNGVKVNKNTSFESSPKCYVKIGGRTELLSASIGNYTLIGANNKLSNTKIGRFCSLGSNISVINAFHPTSGFVSTNPAFYSLNKQCGITFVNRQKFEEHRSVDNNYSVIIGNDVWIGHNVTIIAGITIGDGSIIGANALVTKDVPPFAIVGGVPAKVIRYRFDDESRTRIYNSKWWDNSYEWFVDNAEIMSSYQLFLERFTNG